MVTHRHRQCVCVCIYHTFIHEAQAVACYINNNERKKITHNLLHGKMKKVTEEPMLCNVALVDGKKLHPPHINS